MFRNIMHNISIPIILFSYKKSNEEHFNYYMTHIYLGFLNDNYFSDFYLEDYLSEDCCS